MNELLQKVKKALRQTENTFDDEITDLINACLLDLGIAGVETSLLCNVYTDPNIINAVIAYCKANFGNNEDSERWKTAYDEKKAQLSMYTGYTVWTVDNG